MKIHPLMSFFILSLFASLTYVQLQASVCAGYEIIRVPSDYPIIQEAIDMASPESTILVSSGIYHEHLVVNKPLTLIGQDKATTIVDGNGTGGWRCEDSVICVTVDGVTIDGFTIRNSGGSGYWSFVSGICLASNSNRVMGNIISNNNYGVIIGTPYHKGSRKNTITDNIIQSNNYGIFAYQGGNNTIVDNSVLDNCLNGIWFVGLDVNNTNTLKDNIVSNSSCGICLSGFVILGSATVNTRHNTLQGSSEFSPSPLSNNTISGNNVIGNEYGVHVEYVGGNEIDNNVITSNNHGVNLDESSNNTIIGNTISGNELGINLPSSSNNTIFCNNFVENTQQLGNSSTTNIWDNGAEGNYWSDYTGLDDGNDGRAAGDGVGDTKLPHLGVDYYPLIIPWGPVPVVWGYAAYPVTLRSNSTVSAFRFIQSEKEIAFTVTGPSDTVGYCNMIIPKTLLRDNPWKILLNNTDIAPQAIITENQTHTSIYFIYNHGTYNIQITGTWVIPEFPSATILPLLILLSLILLITTKRKFALYQ